MRPKCRCIDAPVRRLPGGGPSVGVVSRRSPRAVGCPASRRMSASTLSGSSEHRSGVKLIIISGLSGSGKSIALDALEDLGLYCIDNLPVGLLPAFAVEMLKAPPERYSMAAVGVDARNLAVDLERFPDILKELQNLGLNCRILFLDALDETLLQRFSETRRKHPLSRKDMSLVEAIQRERRFLRPLAEHADIHVDTTHTNVHQLRQLIQERIGTSSNVRLSLLFESFGYRNGVPRDADFVFDARCLPNPHWDVRLRPYTGLDTPVIEFLGQQPRVEGMFESIRTFLDQWIADFEGERRSYLTVAIGCTGGQHRSVYLAERLAEHFRVSRGQALTRHRDLR